MYLNSFSQPNDFPMTYGRTPCTSQKVVGRPEPAHDNTAQRGQGQASMSQAGLEPAIQWTIA
jgi:hypothetical protein